MNFADSANERAEAYQILSQFFLSPPDKEALETIRQDFNLNSDETIEELTSDFNILFGLTDGTFQPIESVFSLSIGLPYEDVERFYSKAGLIIDDSYETAPDHLSLELLFMSYLIVNSKTDMEMNFLEQHLMNWVPYYCDLISKEAQTEFYRKIAVIVRDFLTAEYDEYTNEGYGTTV